MMKVSITACESNTFLEVYSQDIPKQCPSADESETVMSLHLHLFIISSYDYNVVASWVSAHHREFYNSLVSVLLLQIPIPTIRTSKIE